MRDPPPLVPGALLPRRGRRRARRGRGLGTPPSAAPRAGTGCAATASSTRTAGSRATSSTWSRAAARTLVFCEVKSKSGDGFGDPLEMVTRREGAPRAAGGGGVARRATRSSRGLRRALRRDRRARGPARARAGRVLRGFADAASNHSRMAATQEAALRGARIRPRPLVVGTRPAQRERTKHVHRLHPYLGKYIPQLVEELLRRHVPAGGRVLDPFAGSGTTLVQALESGYESVGVDIAAFNCLLMRVKTDAHNPFVARARAARRARALRARARAKPGPARRRTSRSWFAPRSRAELLRFRVARSASTRRGRAARRARARRALGPPDDALRPRLPEAAADRAVLVPQASSRVPPGRARRALPPPLHARHAHAPEGVRRLRGPRRPRCSTATP